MDFLEACKRFVEIESSAITGNFEIAKFAEQLCRQAGLFVDFQVETHAGQDQANVIARPQKERPLNELLLQTHLDTVEPGAYGLWTLTGANPFQATVYQDAIYGLGSANAKLDFLCKLEAIRQMAGVNWLLPPVLVGTFGEAQGMAGAIRLIRKKKISAQHALVGEPTELGLVVAAKGIANVEIDIPFSQEEILFRENHNTIEGSATQSRVFNGRSVHSANPTEGMSAIYQMMQFLAKLPEGVALMEMEGGLHYNTVPAHAVLEIEAGQTIQNSICGRILRIIEAVEAIEAEFKLFPADGFAPKIATINLGMIRTHADGIKFMGCVRVPPTVTEEIYERWMAYLRKRCEIEGASFRISEYKQPFATSKQSLFVAKCQEVAAELGLSPALGAQALANEANVFSRLGLECVVFGPGRGVGNSHAPNEYVKINQLEQAVQFYKTLLNKVCL